MRASLHRPTPGELEILRLLWAMGPSTVRDIHTSLGERTGYTTVLKLMQIMLDKGLLARDEKDKTHVYRPAQSQQKTQKRIAADLIDRVFAGSARNLIVSALSARPASRADIDEIRRLLEEHRHGNPGTFTKAGESE